MLRSASSNPQALAEFVAVGAKLVYLNRARCCHALRRRRKS